MAPILTVLEQQHVSPPSGTITDTLLPLTFFDILQYRSNPIHLLFFYDLPQIKLAEFLETIVPSLKHSLSITLQHFFPYAGNLIVFPIPTRNPEIRYLEGDSVKVTIAECRNLDFHDLTGYHPRSCDKFHCLIPVLGDCMRTSDYIQIPVFALQVTIFPNFGVSIGLITHHCLVDATTQFNFLRMWTSIARCGTFDLSFLPIYERLVKFPEREETALKNMKVETFIQDYQLPILSGPTDKVRATFVLNRTFIDQLKKQVMTELKTLPYASSFVIACAYLWCSLAQSRNDERQVFGIAIDCRTRMDPPIPATYFGNCVWGCASIAKRSLLTGKEGFIAAVKLIGENLHEVLTHKDGIVNHNKALTMLKDVFADGIPTKIIGIIGTPKLKLYDVDFGWGKPKKIEWILQNHSAAITIDAAKDNDQDLEIGVSLTPIQMQDFVRIFNLGLESYI